MPDHIVMAGSHIRGLSNPVPKPTAPRVDEPDTGHALSWPDFYGLSRDPFSLHEDHAGYNLFGSHRRGFELLADHLINRSGLVLLHGPAGAGKSAMLHALGDTAVGSGIQPGRVMRLRGGRLMPDALLDSVNDAFSAGTAGVNRVVMLLDDADAMSRDSSAALAGILANEIDNFAIVAAIAAGEIPELAPFVRDRIRLPNLTVAEMRDYIERSLWKAGGTTRRLIAPDALRLIVAQAAGVPGMANRCLEATFTAGFARGERTISVRTIAAAIGPRRLPRPNRFRHLVPIGAIAIFIAGAIAFVSEALQTPAPIPARGVPHAASPKIQSAAPAPTMAPDLIAALMKRGGQSLALGDIAAARLLFQHAAEGGNAAAATATGKTYDPNFLTSGPAQTEQPDPARAAEWYRRAIALGDPQAASLLKRLGTPKQ